MKQIFLSADIFSLSGVILAITSIVLVVILFVYGKTKVHKIWMIFNLSLAWWGVGVYFMGKSGSPVETLCITKIAYVGVIFISVFFYHFSCVFSGISRKECIILAYIQGIFFSFLSISNIGIPYISNVERIDGSSLFYIRSSGLLYNFSFLIWVLLVAAGFLETFIQYLKESYSFRKNQYLYLFWGFFVGFLGGLTNFFPPFHIDIVPLGNFTIPLYCIIATYAILRYHILDIRLALSNTVIFIFVYALVLGIPFIFGYKYHKWEISTWTMLVLATAGPFIYFYLQRRIENQLLKEERIILEILKKAAREIPHIKEIPHLLQFITQNLQKLSVNYVAIYLWDIESNSYNLKESVPNKPEILTIAKDDNLVFELKDKKGGRSVNCLNYDEIQFLVKEDIRSKLQKILPTFEGLSAQVIIPMIDDVTLLGFIVLGKREENKSYSEELMGVLLSIGSLVGSSIADYFYWEKMGLEERRASLDHISSSMAHEIDNPITVIGGQAEGLKMYLEDPRLSSMPEDLRNRMNKNMNYIMEACARVTETVRTIQEYSRGSTGKLIPINLSKVEQSYSTLMGPHFKKAEIIQQVKYIKEIELDLPFILGDKIRLEEILINFANNALHAVRNSEVREVTFKIFRKNGDWVRIEFLDTGYGIEQDMLKDIWLPHVTTKGSVEGTGLGLYIVRKIVDTHGGRTWAESGGKGKGATMIVELPVFKGDINNFEEAPKTVIREMF